MNKKVIILTFFLGVLLTIGTTGILLTGNETSCNRFLSGAWWIHSPANRICSTDYWTNENAYKTNNLNCQNPLSQWSKYTSWRFTTNNQWVSDTGSYFYIPWYESNPVTYADYFIYNKDQAIPYCIGRIDHYNTYGWTNNHICPCVGQYGCYGFYFYWTADKDRLVVTDCATPLYSQKRIYSDAAKINW